MKQTPNDRIMEAYRQQMMEMYRQAESTPSVSDTEGNWLDRRFPEPNLARDKEIIPSPAENSQPVSATENADFVGYLRVYAFTGGGAEPIDGARVIVTHPDGDTQTVYANLTTDRDGFTPVIALPSVDPALTLQPGSAQPYVAYTIRVTAEGFQPTEHRNVPVYGNNYVTQPVAMLPLLPNETGNNTQEFTSGGPTNL